MRTDGMEDYSSKKIKGKGREGVVIVKKIIIVALCLICLISILIFISFKGSYNIKSGVYVADTVNLSRIEFDTTEHRFVFMHTGYLSTLIEGTYECEGKKLIAKSEEDVYAFRIVDNGSVSFIKGESSEAPIEDGTVFKLA